MEIVDYDQFIFFDQIVSCLGMRKENLMALHALLSDGLQAEGEDKPLTLELTCDQAKALIGELQKKVNDGSNPVLIRISAENSDISVVDGPERKQMQKQPWKPPSEYYFG